MKELSIIRTVSARDLSGQRLELCYAVTPEGGAAILCRRGDVIDFDLVPDVTSDERELRALLEQMADGCVTPVTFRDVLRDYVEMKGGGMV